MFLNDYFKARNGVRLTGAAIRNDLFCDNGEFVSKGEEPAINAARTKVQGSVFLNDHFNAKPVCASPTHTGQMDFDPFLCARERLSFAYSS